MDEATFFHIQQFYYLSLAGITGFGGIFLCLIWFHAQKEGIDKESRRGLIFLALSLFSWTLPALIYYFAENRAYCNPTIHSIYDRVLSESNNMFLILTIPYFRYGFEGLKKKYPFLKEIKEWIISVLIIFFAIILLFSIVDAQKNHALKQVVVVVDTLISMIAISLMGYGLGSSFTKRQYGKSMLIITLAVTALMLIANLCSAIKGFSSFQQDCTAILAFRKDLSLLFLFSISCFSILLVTYAHSWILEEKNALLAEKEEDNKLSKPVFAVEDTENIAVENAIFEATEIPVAKASPRESLFLKFSKNNDKFVVFLTDLSKQIVAFPIILNENGKGKKLTQPYMGLLAYALAKLTDNYVQEKANPKQPIHLPDIIAMNNQIRTNLLNPALKKSHFEELNKEDLLEREHQKAYQLRVLKSHIQIEIWDDILKPMSELQEFLLKCGFSEKMLEELRDTMVKTT